MAPERRAATSPCGARPSRRVRSTTMRPWSTIRARVLLVPLLPAIALGLIVGLDLHRSVGVVIAAVVAVVAAFALALIVARSITRPLRDLAVIVADTRELARGRRQRGAGRRRAAAALHAQRLAPGRACDRSCRRSAPRGGDRVGAARRAPLDHGPPCQPGAAQRATARCRARCARRDRAPRSRTGDDRGNRRVHRVVARVDRSTASALVLIGEGGRVAPSPMSITDAVWAAALAIESSDRVDADSLPPAMLHADVVGDVTHLLAELMDNAVVASPPPARVTVLGVPDEDGAYEITVLDVGTGLAPTEIEEANERVRRLELLHRVPTRHIGLAVVGRLARRHNIVVRLGESAAGGVVVRVLLPPSLLTAPAVAEPEADVQAVLDDGGTAPPPVGDSEPVATPSWVHSAGDEPAFQAAAPSPVESWHVDAPLDAPLVAAARNGRRAGCDGRARARARCRRAGAGARCGRARHRAPGSGCGCATHRRPRAGPHRRSTASARRSRGTDRMVDRPDRAGARLTNRRRDAPAARPTQVGRGDCARARG